MFFAKLTWLHGFAKLAWSHGFCQTYKCILKMMRHFFAKECSSLLIQTATSIADTTQWEKTGGIFSNEIHSCNWAVTQGPGYEGFHIPERCQLRRLPGDRRRQECRSGSLSADGAQGGQERGGVRGDDEGARQGRLRRLRVCSFHGETGEETTRYKSNIKARDIKAPLKPGTTSSNFDPFTQWDIP
jgi:hypothetical protein